MTSTDVEVTDPIAELAEKSLYDRADPQKLAMLKATRMKGLSDVEVGMGLELAASLGLNPWANEVYFAKDKRGNILMMVGRDGLLRKAEDFPDYRGYDAGVVYQGDDFEFVDPDPNGATMRERAGVVHRSDPTTGEVLGAWACAERAGRPLRKFYARIEEYRPGSDNQYSPWKSTESVMIEKVPISVVHRTLCNLSGVYLKEELDRALLDGGERGEVVVTAEEEQAHIAALLGDLEASGELIETLTMSIARINELSPAAWNLAKCQMTLPGRSEGELRRVVVQIEEEIEEAETRLAKDPDVEEVTDAQVVEDPAANGGLPTAEEIEVLRNQVAEQEAAVEGMEDGLEKEAARVELDTQRERLEKLTGEEE